MAGGLAVSAPQGLGLGKNLILEIGGGGGGLCPSHWPGGRMPGEFCISDQLSGQYWGHIDTKKLAVHLKANVTGCPGFLPANPAALGGHGRS